MEIYSSQYNERNRLDGTHLKLKQAGEFLFKIPANNSGRVTIKFDIAFNKKPNLNVILSLTNGSESDVRHTIKNFAVTGFELDIINTDLVNEIVGTVNWFAQPW